MGAALHSIIRILRDGVPLFSQHYAALLCEDSLARPNGLISDGVGIMAKRDREFELVLT
jgi:hypothetical protein